MKIVSLNAPPRAGKDTAASGIINAFGVLDTAGLEGRFTPIHMKMADPIKIAAHSLFGYDRRADYHEVDKDTPNPDYMGSTPRQLYIKLSEHFTKHYYGADIFGHIFTRRLQERDKIIKAATGTETLCVCSDLGFNEEMHPLVDAYDASNILVIRIAREGCDFKNDSRSYMNPPPGVTIRHIANKGTEYQFQREAVLIVRHWLEDKGYAKKTITA